ncbi:MAG: hypothetical protein AVDCRST_MAG88-4297, partial [uncultured Thermomicrobiales bacterium]
RRLRRLRPGATEPGRTDAIAAEHGARDGLVAHRRRRVHRAHFHPARTERGAPHDRRPHRLCDQAVASAAGLGHGDSGSRAAGGTGARTAPRPGYLRRGQHRLAQDYRSQRWAVRGRDHVAGRADAEAPLLDRPGRGCGV